MPEPTRILHFGDEGPDVASAQRMLKDQNRWGVEFYPGRIDGVFGRGMQAACAKAKWREGFALDKIDGRYGERLHGFLVPKGWAAFDPLPLAYRLRKAARHGKAIPPRFLPNTAPSPGYPLGIRGEQIGYPYQGSHSHPYPSDPLHNWESCNAVDVGCPKGTPVLAVTDGVIGSRFGPLSSSNPVLLGIRLHLETSSNDYYYAHLSSTTCHPGQHVKRGDKLGYSGVANGVAHLHLASEHGDPGRLIGHPTPGYYDRGYPS